MTLFKLKDRLFAEAEEGFEGSAGAEGSEESAEEGAEGSDSSEVEESEEGAESGNEEENKQAIALFKMLKDPNTSDLVIRQLAQKAGLLKEVETKQDVREAKRDLKAIVKEKLGDEYKFLADKLGDVMEAVLEEERLSQKGDIARIEAQNTEREVQNVLDKLARETKNESRKVESRMVELMDKFTIGKNISVEDYLRGLYAQATASRSSATVKGQMADRINRNSKDTASRLASPSSSSGSQGAGAGTTPSKKMGLNDSVNYALEQMNKRK